MIHTAQFDSQLFSDEVRVLAKRSDGYFRFIMRGIANNAANKAQHNKN